MCVRSRKVSLGDLLALPTGQAQSPPLYRLVVACVAYGVADGPAAWQSPRGRQKRIGQQDGARSRIRTDLTWTGRTETHFSLLH